MGQGVPGAVHPPVDKVGSCAGDDGAAPDVHGDAHHAVVPQVLGCCVFIFIYFYAYFDFFFDLFCDLLVIQQHVFQPPYVGIFNSFSPVIDI